jgi:hypothetical protein
MSGKIRFEQLDKSSLETNLATRAEITTANEEISKKLNSADYTRDSVVSKLGNLSEGEAVTLVGNATNVRNGLISKTDKAKLDAIQEGATNYQHPEYHPSTMITDEAGRRFTSDTEMNSKFDKEGGRIEGDLEVLGHFTPVTNGVQDIGSPDKRFRALYVNEAYLSTNTLYLGDTAVMGTEMDTINIKADPDQSIQVKTTGAGRTILSSESGVNVSSNGVNADVKISAQGTGSKVDISSPNTVNITGDSGIRLSGDTEVDSLVVNGNMTVKGTTFTVDSQVVTAKDNLIEVNSGEVGSGVTAGTAGIRVDRGDANDYLMVFDELDDKFKVGMNGSIEAVLTEKEAAILYTPQIHVGSGGDAHDVATPTRAGFISPEDKTKLDGITENAKHVEDSETNGNILVDGQELVVYKHPTSHPASMITEEETKRFVSDAQIASWDAKAETTVASSTSNGLLSAEDKAKLDTLASGGTKVEDSTVNGNILVNGGEVNVYSHPATHNLDEVTETADKKILTSAERTKLSGIAEGAEVNQNAYSTIRVNGNDISADSKADTFELRAGANISLTPDIDNDAVSIAVTGIALDGHVHSFSEIENKPTTLAGYGISDAVKSSEVVSTATANKVLKLDSNGNLPADVAGNSATASKLENSRTIELSGDVSGSVGFDGSGNVNIVTAIADNSHKHTMANIVDAGTAAIRNIGINAGNVPELDANGKLNTSVIPALAITDTFVVTSDAEMVVLPAQRGDVAVRTDLSKSFILRGDSPSVVSNWEELLAPTNGVVSINGKTGTVTINHSDVGAEQAFAKNTAFNKNFGIVAGTVAEGNHNHDERYLGINANAISASKLNIPRSISLGGDLSGSTTFDGSKNITIEATLAADSHSHVIANIDGLQDALNSKASNSVATQSTNGLMSSTDKANLDNLVSTGGTRVEDSTINGNIKVNGSEVNVYSHPASHTIQEVSGLETALSGKQDKASTAKGVSVFAGEGSTKTIPHGLGVAPSVVMITPNGNPGGLLGEYWYTADATNIYVYNSGTATTGFAWLAFK